MEKRAFFTSITDAPTVPLGPGRGLTRLLVRGDHARELDVHVNVIRIGAGPGTYHYHERSENVYIVLSGVLEVTIEGGKRLLRAGEVAFFPPGVPHAAANGSADAEVEIIEIYAPPPPPEGDYHPVGSAFRPGGA